LHFELQDQLPDDQYCLSRALTRLLDEHPQEGWQCLCPPSVAISDCSIELSTRCVSFISSSRLNIFTWAAALPKPLRIPDQTVKQWNSPHAA